MSKARLEEWEALGFGMFVHFGMSTFLGEECPDGQADPMTYAPDGIDADGWARAAKEAGMRYLVLTAKHVAGHCLWPSRHTDYHIGASANKTDVVAAAAEACAKHGLGLGLYYCSWDNHHRFGTVTAGDVGIYKSHATREYRDFQLLQLAELLTTYGPIFEMWIDIPQVLGPEGRRECYDLCASLQPETFVIMNQGCQGSSLLDVDHAWPTDVATRERQLPECARWGQGEDGATIGHSRWYEIGGERFYVPTEVCDCLGYYWFHDERDQPRSVAEVSAMRTVARARGCNLLLNVPPDRSGQIPKEFVNTLVQSASRS
ncbi:glycoside hydrolase family 29 (alpha-L- fucosidase) [Fimbriimonas ginsengisoli Gsoil 348]|uniref:alpha-L-fucosidase n=1 Tax=Fimbriimonas ginsengisoli Gsoil 348 TaxID=661478 RepID=A0A068NP65_FIMGI|nr:glycoside hydrolase family 29 (alpha-L- fucosidase) [Fimbriimonas ginsengisoli Gsoil 348]